MKSLEEVKEESTCHKRVTICEIYDVDGNLLSRESNRCNPDGGKCGRLGVVQNKENYDVESTCNWIHAEIMAVNALPENCSPHKSVLYGHTFYCDDCENKLREAGVTVFEVSKEQING